MKSLNIPFVEGLEDMDFTALLKATLGKSASAEISSVNWPEDFPYRPEACASIARSRTHICVIYNVMGYDLRAMELEDNGRVWEDSCCEFFVADPSDGTYYNFEMNCIGTLLAARRRSRDDATPFTPAQLGRIVRHAGLAHERLQTSGGPFEWSVAALIPFDLIGVDCEALPEFLMGNFYKCGDLTPHPHFLSWNPVDTPSPDFHRPEFFGKLYLRG